MKVTVGLSEVEMNVLKAFQVLAVVQAIANMEIEVVSSVELKHKDNVVTRSRKMRAMMLPSAPKRIGRPPLYCDEHKVKFKNDHGRRVHFGKMHRR